MPNLFGVTPKGIGDIRDERKINACIMYNLSFKPRDAGTDPPSAALPLRRIRMGWTQFRFEAEIDLSS